MESNTCNTQSIEMDITEIILLIVVLSLSIFYWTSLEKKKSTNNKKNIPVKAVALPKRKKSILNHVNDSQEKSVMILFFGSQTGTAEDLAKRFGKQVSSTMGITVHLCDFEDYDYKQLTQLASACHKRGIQCLCGFFMATYGEGEPTDNALEFYDWIMDGKGKMDDEGDDAVIDETLFENLQYFVFALGNKTYEHFNAIGRRVDKRLVSCGAVQVVERGEGDDDGNMEDDFLKWKDNVFSLVAQFYSVDISQASTTIKAHVPLFQMSAAPAVFKGELTKSVDHPRNWASTSQGQFQETSAAQKYDLKHPYYAPIVKSVTLFNGSTDVYQQDQSSLAQLSQPMNEFKFEISNSQLTCERQCFHIEFDISASGMSYKTGDHIGIWPSNQDYQVQLLASQLKISGQLDDSFRFKSAHEPSPFPNPTTLRTILTHYVDLNAIMKQHHLEILAQYSTDSFEQNRLFELSKDRLQYVELIEHGQKTCSDLLHEFPSIQVPTSVLLTEILPRISHRYYSISSCSLTQPHTVSITAVVVRYALTVKNSKNPLEPSKTVLKQGLTTSWLQQLHLNNFYCQLPPLHVPCYIRTSSFRLPTNPSIPIIMVGPGTGIAPFRGFVLERHHLALSGTTVGATMLFFGCRHPEKDFLYKKELENVASQWPAFTLITAFSRLEGHSKTYVQHKLREYKSQLWNLLYQQGGHFYVCGFTDHSDAKNMARDVHQALIEMAVEFGNFSTAQATEWVKLLKSQLRYQEDVWA